MLLNSDTKAVLPVSAISDTTVCPISKYATSAQVPARNAPLPLSAQNVEPLTIDISSATNAFARISSMMMEQTLIARAVYTPVLPAIIPLLALRVIRQQITGE